MRKLWKGVLLGGAVGAGIAAVQASRREGETDVAVAVAKTAGEAALVGGAVGWFLDRRERKRRARTPVGKFAGALAVAETALPVIQHAAEVAARRAADAAEAARPHVQSAAQHAADVARPRVQHAADVVRPHVVSAAETARDRAEAAREAAKRKAAETADSALRRVAERDGPVIVAV